MWNSEEITITIKTITIVIHHSTSEFQTSLISRPREPMQAGCLFECSKYKEMYDNIEEFQYR